MTSETDILLIERGKSYGTFARRSNISQQLKNVMKSQKGWTRLTADQRETLEMIACKVSRILNGDPNHVDSWVDIAGYAKLVSDRLEGIQR